MRRSGSAPTGPTTCWCCRGSLRDELVEQLSYVREWGGKLVFPIPELEVVSPRG
jgi:hypothetical protein